VIRHQAVWADRMSDNAADKSLRLYECVFIAFTQGVLFLILFLALMKFELTFLAYVSIVVTLAIGAACLLLGLHYGREAGIDIAQSNGLPNSAWRRARVKTPASFDKWLAKEKAKSSSPGS
jgi:VIT1/CCC1 family predicted Fe2+/Mn2+ transporter